MPKSVYSGWCAYASLFACSVKDDLHNARRIGSPIRAFEQVELGFVNSQVLVQHVEGFAAQQGHAIFTTLAITHQQLPAIHGHVATLKRDQLTRSQARRVKDP